MTPYARPSRLGGLAGLGYVAPDDFDRMFEDEIRAMFEANELFPSEAAAGEGGRAAGPGDDGGA